MYTIKCAVSAIICGGRGDDLSSSGRLLDVNRLKRSRWLLLPFNPGWYWILFACEIRTGNVHYYDSHNSNYKDEGSRVLRVLRHVLDRDDGELVTPSNTPQQHFMNEPGVDCGAFCCGFAHMVCCGGSIGSMNQRLMNDYRSYIGCCIHTHSLL